MRQRQTISTFNINPTTYIDVVHDFNGIYPYTEDIVAALMDEKSPNPVVDTFHFMVRFLAPMVIDGRQFKYIKPGMLTHDVIRHCQHRTTFWSARSLKMTISDILVEDKDPTMIPVFDGDVLAFNTAISQYYEKPKLKSKFKQ